MISRRPLSPLWPARISGGVSPGDPNGIGQSTSSPLAKILRVDVDRGKQTVPPNKNPYAKKKQGFGLPIDRWMREDLAPLSRDVLLDRTASERGLLSSRSGLPTLAFAQSGQESRFTSTHSQIGAAR